MMRFTMFGLLLLSIGLVDARSPSSARELRFALRADPKTFHPLRISDTASSTVRYLTAGVLLRLDRASQRMRGELAERWTVSADGRTIRFWLRPGLRFSDGSPLEAAQAAFCLRLLFDPRTHAAEREPFALGSEEAIVAARGLELEIALPRPVTGLERLFDSVPIFHPQAVQPGARPADVPTAGPFRVAAYRPGEQVLLERNPHYFARDERGRRLPHAERLVLIIQQDRSAELIRFLRGELDGIERLEPDNVDQLASKPGIVVRDLGPSLDTEQLWFNLSPRAPIASYKRNWFSQQGFRRAVSAVIDRRALARVVYRGHALPALGPISPANAFWANRHLRAADPDLAAARRWLQSAGFVFTGGELKDRDGRRVEFTILTNAGNRPREHMAAMVAQDLARLGMRVSIATLDFPSLIERLTRTLNYESCLLGLVLNDLDPNEQSNVWLSSGPAHQWNPMQTSPATQWEAEIDRLMLEQAAERSPTRRKRLFDSVQQIVVEQAPFIYLVYPHALVAYSKQLQGVAPAVLSPRLLWNAERLSIAEP
jgi:peptide/nickel transport system substrate-binding protein